jgi:type IV pilus assembly protein PilC
VTTGGSLSEALTKYPKVFSPLYINMVKAGEAGGVLEIVLERLSTFMEKNLELGRKIKAALTYPALVVLFAGGVLLFLTVYLIPQFMGIFETLDVGKLPTITAVTMSISNFFQNQWYIGIGALIGLFVFYKALLKNEKAKYLIDKGKLRLPIAGDLLRKIEVTRFSRTLGTLISSGVPILQALRITEGVVNNKVISDAIGKVHNSIREGESIASPLKASGVFPLMVVNMVDVGEETGSLDEMFVKVADIYDSEVDTTVDSLTSIIEPVLIITMGLIVGFIVVSMFLPLIKLMTSIGMRA